MGDGWANKPPPDLIGAAKVHPASFGRGVMLCSWPDEAGSTLETRDRVGVVIRACCIWGSRIRTERNESCFGDYLKEGIAISHKTYPDKQSGVLLPSSLAVMKAMEIQQSYCHRSLGVVDEDSPNGSSS